MLEDVLKKYFNLENDMFDDEDELTEEGLEAYNRLTRLLYDIGSLTEIDMNKTIDKLDDISRF